MALFAVAQRDLRNWYHDVRILRHIFVSDALTSPSVLYQGDMYRQPGLTIHVHPNMYRQPVVDEWRNAT